MSGTKSLCRRELTSAAAIYVDAIGMAQDAIDLLRITEPLSKFAQAVTLTLQRRCRQMAPLREIKKGQEAPSVKGKRRKWHRFVCMSMMM